MDRPFSQACENNKQPILEVLQQELSGCDSVLEIGSGTGQHARYFAERMPRIAWQPTDRAPNLAGIESWREDYEGSNLLPAQPLDVSDPVWEIKVPAAVFSANTLHIMSWELVQTLFSRLAELAPEGSRLLVYGPFNYGGQYTSPSNARFDQWLAQQDPCSAIRDFEAVDALAAAAGYALESDYEMPANNRLLVWQRSVRNPA